MYLQSYPVEAERVTLLNTYMNSLLVLLPPEEQSKAMAVSIDQVFTMLKVRLVKMKQGEEGVTDATAAVDALLHRHMDLI